MIDETFITLINALTGAAVAKARYKIHDFRGEEIDCSPGAIMELLPGGMSFMPALPHGPPVPRQILRCKYCGLEKRNEPSCRGCGSPA